MDISTNGGVDFTEDRVGYSFRPPLRVRSFSPSSGPETGNTKILVQGLGFVASKNLACRFGEADSSAPAKFISETEIECTSPVQRAFICRLLRHDEWNRLRESSQHQ